MTDIIILEKLDEKLQKEHGFKPYHSAKKNMTYYTDKEGVFLRLQFRPKDPADLVACFVVLNEKSKIVGLDSKWAFDEIASVNDFGRVSDGAFLDGCVRKIISKLGINKPQANKHAPVTTSEFNNQSTIPPQKSKKDVIIKSLTPVAFHSEYYTGRSSSILREMNTEPSAVSGGYLFYNDYKNKVLCAINQDTLEKTEIMNLPKTLEWGGGTYEWNRYAVNCQGVFVRGFYAGKETDMPTLALHSFLNGECIVKPIKLDKLFTSRGVGIESVDVMYIYGTQVYCIVENKKGHKALMRFDMLNTGNIQTIVAFGNHTMKNVSANDKVCVFIREYMGKDNDGDECDFVEAVVFILSENRSIVLCNVERYGKKQPFAVHLKEGLIWYIENNRLFAKSLYKSTSAPEVTFLVPSSLSKVYFDGKNLYRFTEYWVERYDANYSEAKPVAEIKGRISVTRYDVGSAPILVTEKFCYFYSHYFNGKDGGANIFPYRVPREFQAWDSDTAGGEILPPEAVYVL
jgi:hypothetical protein